jgi:hypothetical protein
VKRRSPKVKWGNVQWTRFEKCEVPDSGPPDQRPHERWRNSIYEVSVWFERSPFFQDHVAHLVVTTRDLQVRHDWRELQRIKNEICGAEAEGLELFPAESRLVDTKNEYHLYVFNQFKVPLGTQVRQVSEGGPGFGPSGQREFPVDARPADLGRPPAPKRPAPERKATSADPVGGKSGGPVR